jgi:hypothetical protein
MNATETASRRASPGGLKRNLTSISPFFIVKDLQASISHYIERFGFQLDFQGPADDVYYGHVSRDGIGGPGTNGLAGMPTSTPWNPTRCSTSSSSGVRHS